MDPTQEARAKPRQCAVRSRTALGSTDPTSRVKKRCLLRLGSWELLRSERVVIKHCGNTSAEEESGCKQPHRWEGQRVSELQQMPQVSELQQMPQGQHTVTSSLKKKKSRENALK